MYIVCTTNRGIIVLARYLGGVRFESMPHSVKLETLEMVSTTAKSNN